MPLPHISPAQAKALLDQGAILVDIRDVHEHAGERIPAARNLPMSQLTAKCVGSEDCVVVFHCKSGMRTRMNARHLATAAGNEAFIMDGGIDAWKRAGLPVARG